MNRPSEVHRFPEALTGLWLVGFCLVALVLYANTLFHPFLSDDKVIVAGNSTVLEPSWAAATKLWTTDYWSGVGPDGKTYRLAHDENLYRPITIFSFLVNGVVTGVNPPGFRLINLLLHALAAWLVGWLAVRWMGLAAGWVAAAIVLFHPLATDVVNCIVGRADMLVLVGIAGFLLLQRAAQQDRWTWWRAVLATLFAAVALGAKESGMVLLPLAVVQEWLATRSEDASGSPYRSWPGAVALAIPAIAYATGRLLTVGLPDYQPTGRAMDANNPVLGLGLVDRLPAVPAVAADYLQMFFAPWRLAAADYRTGVPQWSDADVWLGSLFLVVIAIALLATLVRRHPLALALAWWMASFLLVSQLVAPIGVFSAARLAYPMLGAYALALGWLLGCVVWERWRWPKVGWSVAVAMLVVLAIQVRVRNHDYRSSLELVKAAATRQPDNAMLAVRLGSSYAVEDQYDAARQEIRRAIELAPDSHLAWNQLGIVEILSRQPLAAREALEKALGLNPNHIMTLGLLAQLAIDADDLDKAEDYLSRAEDLEPTVGQETALIISERVRLEQRRGRIDSAVRHMERLMNKNPHNPEYVESLKRLKALQQVPSRR